MEVVSVSKIFILLNSLLVIFTLNPLHIEAKVRPEISPECMEMRMEHYTNSVIKDIMSNFDIDLESEGFIEMNSRNLDATNLIYGGNEKDDYYNSLIQHFNVSSKGWPRLFVRPQETYVLYKDLDNTDVMIHMIRMGSKWEVIEQQQKKGNNIQYEKINCEKE